MDELKKFSDIEYKRVDFKDVRAKLKKYTNDIKNAADFNTVKESVKEVEGIIKNVFSMSTISSIRNTMNMKDEFYDKEEKYLAKASATMALSIKALYKAVLASKFIDDIKKEYGEFFVKNIEISQKLFSYKILFLSIKESNLSQKYSKDAALCKTDFRGEECNFYGLLNHMQSIDRDERKEAFEAWANLYESVSEKLDDTYDKLVKIRVKIAKRLGFENYIDYVYLSRGRYDYKKEDVERFRNEVRDYIVPICKKLYEKQTKDLGIDKLHYYDESLTFKEGNAKPVGTKDELVEKARLMYEELSKESGEYFNFMVEHELFDLETRPGKHLGGYCTFIPNYKAPFIFSNFNGTSDDVDVLTHEAGHAFQAYLAARNIDSMMQMSSTSEINEIHSMSMEHFAYPYMDKFFENPDKYRYHHLVNALETIPYLVSVDEFQHRVFENPSMDRYQRRAAWKKIEEIYLPWRDYDGNKFLSEGGFWMQKQHIFLYPFYYVDYALAQVCAFQIFIKDRKDHNEAWTDYMNLCKAGGTKGYFDLLDVANLKNPFKEGTVKEIASEIEKIIDEFEKKI